MQQWFMHAFNGHVVEDQEVTEGEFSMAWGALFDGYLNTHSLHCKSSDDDDDRKWTPVQESQTGIQSVDRGEIWPWF